MSYDYISQYLVSIYNNLFENAEYPKSWGLGYIIPIFKGGDSKAAKNYRGITLNNILAKIYSQILLNRLTKWTEMHEQIIKLPVWISKRKKTLLIAYSFCNRLSLRFFTLVKNYTLYLSIMKNAMIE